MDLKRSSYHFHTQLESLPEFVRREWKSIAICGGFFCLFMTAAVMLIDPAYFYPRLQTDPLNYYLKAKALVETGSTAARWTVNGEPFAYVSMPGVLRAPLIAAFGDFDDQLRAMQLVNIPLVASVALLSAFILSWALPKSRHWLAVVFAFGFTFVSPIWIANVFLPLADAPYAAFTLAAVVIVVEILCSPKPVTKRPVLVVLFVGLFAVAFMLRYTAPVVLLFAGILADAKSKENRLSQRQRLALLAGVTAVLAVLVAINFEPIFHRYIMEPLSYVIRSSKIGIIVNFFGAALPSQVIPSFHLGFIHPPVGDLYATNFSKSVPDMAWAAVGTLISLIVVTGAWLSRKRLLPEIVYLAGALPAIGVMIPSTMRYLMSYQPFIWIFFYVGFAWLVNQYVPGVKALMRSRLALAVVAMLVVGLVGGLRWWKTAGTASERYFAVSATRIPNYVTEVSSTFRSLREYLETLPADRTLLIGGLGTAGRWKAIAGRDYLHPDSTLTEFAKKKDVYLLVECGTLEACQAWDIWKRRSISRVRREGRFAFDSVFGASAGRSRAEVLRVSPLD